MAHSSVTRPDPFESQEPERPLASKADATEEPVAGRSLSQYLSALEVSGGGHLSAEVALDLVLNDIVERACLATGATSAAIALARDGEMVCRATTGANAPDIGTRLATSHGLSGACVRTGEWQRCDDPESDSRVDADVCRRLDIRSILVVPVVRADGVIGVIEIFSIRSNAFSDREGRILQAFSREIVENVDCAAGLQTGKPEPDLVADSENSPSSESTIAAPDIPSAEAGVPQKGFWTTALLVCVILLALILGWMVGHAGWRPTAIKPVTGVRQAVESQPEAAAVDSSTIAPSQQPAPREQAAPTAGFSSTANNSAPDEGLVVTRNGKVIFRTPPQPTVLSSAASPPAGLKNAASPPGLRISPEIAQEYLASRVEPQYPEQARKNRIQGPVVLDAWVDRDGAVKRLIAISGDPQLLGAATQAVAQWRFRPFFHAGQPEEFVTRITVVFRLP
jgi:TonB family protein